MRSIDSLKFDPKNARNHDEKNIQAIMSSLELVGQRKPIVIYSDMVVAGNGTLEAARRLGWSEIWVNDDPFKSLKHAKAYGVTDNRTAELAAWHTENLGEIIEDLKIDFDLDVLGFKEHELDLILSGGFVPDLPDENGNVSEKKITLTVTLDDLDQQQELFDELKERGFKVKA